jgi:hypothetical protein
MSSLRAKIVGLEGAGISHAEILYELKHLLREIRSEIIQGR